MYGHQAVLLNEVLSYLDPQPGRSYIDATFGAGGHTRALLERTAPGGRVLALDLDDSVLAQGRQAFPDGQFSGSQLVLHKANFKDSGQFVIEGQDQLILKIVMSRGKIQQPAVEKRHTFSLSEDGMELRMIAKDGKVGVFRR